MRHVRRLPGNLLLAAALGGAFGGCGHRGPPLPPLRHTPPSLQDFRLAQRGSLLEVSVLAPAASVDGLGYESLALEFLFVEGQKDLEKAGTRRQVLAQPRQRVVETLPLPAPGTVARAAARGVFGKEKGPRTLTLGLIAQAEVAAPGELEASLTDEGVRLSWTGDVPTPVDAAVHPPRIPGFSGAGPPSAAQPSTTPAAAKAGSLPASPPEPAPPETARPEESKPETAKPEKAKPDTSRPADEGGPAAAGAPGEKRASDKKEPGAGFLVYRRVGSAAYAAPLTPRALEMRALNDTTAPQGEKVCYVVRAAASIDPLVESAASKEACVDVRDIAAPATPTGLAVLPREHGLELVWTPSTEDDLAFYRVYREAPGEPRKRIAKVEAGLAAWTDETARPGVVYQYALTAVDRSGNESPATPEVEASLQ